MILARLFFPWLILCYLGSRTQQGGVGFKQKQHFSSADRLLHLDQALTEHGMDFIHRFVLSEPQLPHEQDNIQPKRKALKRQGISLATAIEPLVPWTIRPGTTISTMNHFDHLGERNDRSGRNRHRPL